MWLWFLEFDRINFTQKPFCFFRKHLARRQRLLLLLWTLQCDYWVNYLVCILQLRSLLHQSLLRNRLHTIWFLGVSLHSQRVELLFKPTSKLLNRCVLWIFRVLLQRELILPWRRLYYVLWWPRQSLYLTRGAHSLIENQFWDSKLLYFILLEFLLFRCWSWKLNLYQWDYNSK